MAEKIIAFERRDFPLNWLISDLEGLLCVLQDALADWKASFYGEWAVLENVYASVLDPKNGS